MPSTRYTTPPTKVFHKEGDTKTWWVQYEGVAQPARLHWLNRLDLMKVGGAIAKSKGEKTGGTRWNNDQLLVYIKENAPWEAKPGEDKPSPKPKKKKGDEEVPEEDGQGRIKTTVTCECGHSYTYRIKKERYEATKKWLETKPCPPCQKGEKPDGQGGMPGGQQQEGEDKEYEQEMDDDLQDDPEIQEKKEINLGDLDLDKLADVLVQKVQERMKPVVLPPLHHEVMPEVIKALNSGCAVWMQGPPGTSKSTIGAQAAQALELPFHAISCHEAMTRSDLFGYTDANGTDHRSPLWEAYEHGGVLLLDEIDNGNANIIAALNSALSNDFCTFAGKTIKKHPNFRALAAANTAGLGPEAGFIGRMGVDLATLDRFVTIMVPIDEKLETAIVKEIMHGKGYADVLRKVRKIRKEVESRGLRAVVSPRTSIHVARMMMAGVPLVEGLKRTALKGMDDTTTKSLLQAAELEA